MNKKVVNVLKYALSAGLMVLLLYLAFRNVSWENFANGVKATDFRLVLCSMAFGLSAFVLRALRWRQLLSPLDSSITSKTTFEGVNLGNIANCALPFAGEFVRCGVVSTPLATFDKTLGTIALERVWDLVSIILIVVLALVMKGGAACSFLSEHIWQPISENWGSRWWIFVLAIAFIVAAILHIYAHRKTSRFCGKMYGVVSGIAQGFISFAKMDKKLMFLVYTVLIWTMYWMMCVCITYAFPESSHLVLADTLFIMAVGNLASVIPVPGGFGAYHTIIALSLSGIYGMSWDSGLVFATLSHESQAINMIMFGLISYFTRTLSKKKK